MPTLNIKNQHVYELAKELSERTGQSMTSVIEVALERRLAELRDTREGIADALHAIAVGAAPLLKHLPEDPFADLYDEETGLPR
jgi:antitoxin VapB